MSELTPRIVSVETRGIIKTFGKRRVVDQVDLRVNSGEIVGLLGPNGAGKTTSFYMIVGLVAPTEGQVFFDQQDITNEPMYRRARMGIGYLPQEPSVFRTLSVEDNIRAIAETLNLSRSDRNERVEQALAELGLTKLARQKAYTLSGGERRRLEISRALITNPSFLLMDEPFSGVDPISVAEVQEIVLGLKEKGIGVLITDHNVRETLRIVDRAYLLYEGRVLVDGKSDDLIQNEDAQRVYLGKGFDL